MMNGNQSFQTIFLNTLKDEVANCTKCSLSSNRIKSVFSRGSYENPKIIILGEGPGKNESQTGIPFVGRSGDLLNCIFEDFGLNVETDIYVCNVIKCHPPNNRKPTKNEIASCKDYLLKQLANVNCNKILAVGSTATQTLLNTELPISQLRSKEFAYGNFRVFPTYHPAYILRNSSKTGPIFTGFISDIQNAIEA